jgi:hypothetical protein
MKAITSIIFCLWLALTAVAQTITSDGLLVGGTLVPSCTWGFPNTTNLVAQVAELTNSDGSKLITQSVLTNRAAFADIASTNFFGITNLDGTPLLTGWPTNRVRVSGIVRTGAVFYSLTLNITP